MDWARYWGAHLNNNMSAACKDFGGNYPKPDTTGEKVERNITESKKRSRHVNSQETIGLTNKKPARRESTERSNMSPNPAPRYTGSVEGLRKTAFQSSLQHSKWMKGE